MYSHYLHDDDWMVLDDQPAQEPSHRERPHSQPTPPANNALFREVSGGLTQLLDGLGKHFSLENIDTGDILLVLILLFLFLFRGPQSPPFYTPSAGSSGPRGRLFLRRHGRRSPDTPCPS